MHWIQATESAEISSRTTSISELWNNNFLEFISSFGIALGAIAAIFTLFFVGIKGTRSQWNDNFRDLYGQFWNDEIIATARKYIIYDDRYKGISEILKKVSIKEETISANLSDEEIAIIEIIDRFFAKCTAFTLLSRAIFIGYRKRRFRKIFLKYWFDKISHREELKKYMEAQWPTLWREFLIHERGSQGKQALSHIRLFFFPDDASR